MKIGGVGPDGNEYFNTRVPVLNEDEVTYLINHFGPKNTDPDASEIDLSPTVQFVVQGKCLEKASAFDNMTTSCPRFTP